MGGSDSDSGDEDDAADFQAQVSQLLAPVVRRVKKVEKALKGLEGVVGQLKSIADDQLPSLRRELTTSMVETGGKMERLSAEIAQCASKTTVEVLRQEQSATETRLRAALDEQRGKAAAQELLVQSLESRVEAMERAMRASEMKVGGELSAATASLSQLTASTERVRGELDARLAEVSARASSQHDGLLVRLAKEDEERRHLLDSLCSKAEMAEARASMGQKQDELGSALAQVQTGARARQELIDGILGAMPSMVRIEGLAKLEARTDALADELRAMLKSHGVEAESDRASWEDRLMGRQHALETAAAEARGLWHKLEAQVEQVQAYCAERALRTEHDELRAAVDALAASAATKRELGATNDIAKAAAKGDAFVVLEAEVRSLRAGLTAAGAATSDGFARTADAEALAALDERVSSLQQLADGKMGAQEAQFALSSKLEKGLGEQMEAELSSAQQRLNGLLERANEAELANSQAMSALQAAASKATDQQAQLDALRAQQEQTRRDSHRQVSDMHDLIKAVRALTQDADMRCALDEREIEFLWAAPAQIYGQHGWRPNNGSKSERTPYPAGNFKMAVKHGGEMNAKEVIARRKKWLNSITVGQRDALDDEADAADAGNPHGVPIRLPTLDEIKRGGSRVGSPNGDEVEIMPASTATSSVLEPARALLEAHPDYSMGGLPRIGAAGAGRPLPQEGKPRDARGLQPRPPNAAENLAPWAATA